jgi:hypothetical protein
MADLVGFGSFGVNVALATGNGRFAQPTLALGAFGAGASAGGWTSNDTYPRMLADINADGMADIVGFDGSGVRIAHGQSNGTFASVIADLSNFGADAPAGPWTSYDSYPRLVADLTGDQRPDILGFGNLGVYLAQSHDLF